MKTNFSLETFNSLGRLRFDIKKQLGLLNEYSETILLYMRFKRTGNSSSHSDPGNIVNHFTILPIYLTVQYGNLTVL